MITPKDVERYRQINREKNERNLGYVMITFSHADEARLLCMEAPESYLGRHELKIDIKANVDHGDLDMRYYMNRARNDSKLVTEMETLRQTKRQLKEFEADIDNQLPSRKKLNEFRELAKDLIEDNKYHTKLHKSTKQRTPEERAALNDKIKALEKAYPHVDFTQLFETDRSEAARKAQHKNAFASYKAYQFLKHGVKKQPVQEQTGLSKAKQRLQDNDPYNFPELDRTVHSVISDSITTPQLLDGGDTIRKPGRRFNGYTEQEYLDAFFGKDRTRPANLE